MAMPHEITMHAKLLQVILYQQHRRVVPCQVEAAQDLQFQAFNINGHKVTFWIVRLCRDFIQRSHFHFFHPVNDDTGVQTQPRQTVIARRHI